MDAAPAIPAQPASQAVVRPEHRSAILIAAILASAIGFIDGSIVAIALPAMRASLGATQAQAQWFANAYLLILASVILAGGAFGDRFGIARVFGSGTAAFVLASVGCALATTPAMMIAARALQGLGAAFMVPGSMAIIARAYPPGERGRAIGIWASASAITTAAGPILGGLLLGWGGPAAWRLVFAINVPLGGTALWLLATRSLPDRGRPGRRIDWIGTLLAIAGLGLTALGLTHAAEGGSASLGTTAAGVAALGGFIVWESRTAAPMLPLRLFADRAFAAANAATFLIYFGLTAMLFFLPMAAIAAWGLPPIEVTFAFLPTSVLIGLLSSRFGRLADRIGPGPLIAGGAALVAAGQGLVALGAPTQDFWGRIIPPMILSALGMSALVAPLSAAVMARAGADDSGIASGVNNAVARMASLMAVAAMGGVAAAAYRAAAGPLDFGTRAQGAAHAAASAHALSVVAGTASAMTAAAALIAAFGIRRAAALH